MLTTRSELEECLRRAECLRGNVGNGNSEFPTEGSGQLGEHMPPAQGFEEEVAGGLEEEMATDEELTPADSGFCAFEQDSGLLGEFDLADGQFEAEMAAMAEVNSWVLTPAEREEFARWNAAGLPRNEVDTAQQIEADPFMGNFLAEMDLDALLDSEL
jgi:hypothetical protein